MDKIVLQNSNNKIKKVNWSLSFISSQKQKVDDIIVNYPDLRKKIIKWEFREVVELIRNYGFDISDESPVIFLAWLISWLKDFNKSTKITDVYNYLLLYEDPKIFYYDLLSAWYIELAYLLKKDYPELNKYDDYNMDNFLWIYLEKYSEWFRLDWVNIDINQMFNSIAINPIKYVQIYNNKEFLLENKIPLNLIFNMYSFIDELVVSLKFRLLWHIYFSQTIDIEKSEKKFIDKLKVLVNKNTKNGIYIGCFMTQYSCDLIVLDESRLIIWTEDTSDNILFYDNKDLLVQDLEFGYTYYKNNLEESNDSFIVLFFDNQFLWKTPWPINIDDIKVSNESLFKKCS